MRCRGWVAVDFKGAVGDNTRLLGSQTLHYVMSCIIHHVMCHVVSCHVMSCHFTCVISFKVDINKGGYRNRCGLLIKYDGKGPYLIDHPAYLQFGLC